LPIALLAFSIFRNPNRTVAQMLTQGSGWLNVALVGVIGAALQSRQRLRTTLDRRFFREAYQQEQVLVQLIDEVRQRDSLGEIAKLVSTRIDSVLHPTTLQIFYRAEERSETFVGQSSSGALAGRQLSQQQTLLRIVDGSTAIQDFPADFAGALPDGERGWLEGLGVRLIVPITGTRERLVGVLLLGERMSDEPYSATDRRLLQGIASQMGLVYENEHLKQRARQDADVRRDVLARLEERSISLLKECPVCGACYDSASERCDQDSAELVLTLPVERTLDGKYRLDRALGRGGFGAVYEASDVRLQRRVAAKVMMGSLFGDHDALRRFEREARAAARIDHPHITRVHDYGAVGSGGAFLIMDFGLAKVMDATGATESVTVATAMGTLGYMAPETLTGAVVDERADLFAIGVMVVETFVGARPFDGETPQAVLAAPLHSDYHLPGASPETRALDAVVRRCLAKDPRDRYGSAAELAKDLVPALARCGDVEARLGPAASRSPTRGGLTG
jgi:hypothetical protein